MKNFNYLYQQVVKILHVRPVIFYNAIIWCSGNARGQAMVLTQFSQNILASALEGSTSVILKSLAPLSSML